MTSRSAILVLAFLCAAAVSAQQRAPQPPQPPPTAVIRGHVISAAGGKPVPRAAIVVAPMGGTNVRGYRKAVADEQGAFQIVNLPPGTYRVHSQRDGYLPGEYGKRPAGFFGVPVVLSDGGSSADVQIVMTPTAVITGRVIEDGRPVRKAIVRAKDAWAMTDDLGEYRLFDLAPGAHIVSAQPPQLVQALTADTLDPAALAVERMLTTFYPGTHDKSTAVPIVVRAGQIAEGVELVLRSVPTFHVRGRLEFPPELRRHAFSVRLQSADGAMNGFSAPAPDGVFDVAGVPPGQYHLAAQTSNIQPAWFGRQTLTVAGHADDIVVQLQPAVTVTGRLTVDGRMGRGDASLNLIRVTPGPGLTGYAVTRFQFDGTFVLQNVEPAEYTLRLNSTRPIWISLARLGGVDALEMPAQIGQDAPGRILEIVASTAASTIDAAVTDGRGQPASGVLVVAIRQLPRGLAAVAHPVGSTGADGRARIEGVPPGSYTVFATGDVPAQEWHDPNVVRAHQGQGTPLQAREGDTHSVSLKVTP